MVATENRLWKQTFVSDISRSPTAATILLRSIAENPKDESTSEQMQRVAVVWNSVVEDAVASMANSSRLQTSGRLEA
jgi:GTP cyclohydrolase I